MPAEIHISAAIRQLCGSRGVDAAIAALATQQYGVASRIQLGALGLSAGEIRHRIDSGRLIRLFPGVYAVGHRKLSKEGRWMAAVLAGGEGAVLSHRSAAALHGLVADDARTINVTGHRRSRGKLRFHRTNLMPDETATKDGIPVTTVPRTLLDLATQTNDWHLERALREALYQHQTNLPTLRRIVENHPGHRGARRLNRAIQHAEDAPGIFRSNTEQRFARWLRKHSLPSPEFNARIKLGDRRIEADCYWHEQRLVAEIDHRATHAQRVNFESDRIRDRAIQAHGLRIIRIAEPYDEALLVDLRRLLGAGSLRTAA